MGNYKEALKYYKKALAIKEKVLGEEHTSTATSYNNIGLLYKTMGNYKEALNYYKKALSIREKVLGKEHPDTAVSYNNIGLLYDDMGNYKEALNYYKKALAIFKKVLGEEHPSTATSYNNIGSLYDDMGNYKEALKYYKKDLAISKKVLGEEHPNTAISYNNIGWLYYETKDYKSSYSYFKKSYNIFINNRDRLFKVLNNKQKKLYLKSNSEKIPSLLLSASAYINQDSSIKSQISKEVMDSWILYKGSIFDSENTIAMLRGSTKDRALKAKIDKLLSMQRELAKVYQSYPKPKQRDAWKQKIKELESSIDSIKSEIASKSAKFKEQLGFG